MSGIHDWRFPSSENELNSVIRKFLKKLTVLCGPDDCSSRMRIRISSALAF